MCLVRSATPLNYRAEIDGLRTVAVVPVVLFHAGVDRFGGGFVGVDVFFVISGYLITSIILREMQSGTFSLAGFYERRARRILPALFFVILVCLPFTWLLLPPQELATFAQSVLAVVTFSSNILFWAESGYFDTAAELKPLLHTWSLAVEEQYYLLFPLLLMACWRFGKNVAAGILTVLFIASLIAAQWSVGQHPDAAFFLLPTRGWELLAGGFCAFWLNAPRRSKALAVDQLAGLSGLLLIIFAVLMFDSGTPTPGVYTLLPVLGTVLIIICGVPGTLVCGLLSARWLVVAGTLSYSIYLWHQPVFAFLRHYTGEHLLTWPAILACLTLTFLLAFLTARYVENPVRSKSRFSRAQVFFYSLLVSLLIAVIGGAGVYYHGFENRFKRQLAGDTGHVTFHTHLHENYPDCEPLTVAEEAPVWKGFLRCKQSSPGIADIVLLGDSHAEHLFFGLAESLPDENTAFYIQASRPYLDNSDFKTIFDELLSHKHDQLILLTMHFYSRVPGNTGELYRGFSDVVRALLEAGREVVLLGDIPEYPNEPERCVYEMPSAVRSSDSSVCSMDKNIADDQKAGYEAVLQRISAEQDVRYINLYPLLCNNARCSMASGDSVLYRDEHHLNLPGSLVIGRYLAEQIADLL